MLFSINGRNIEITQPLRDYIQEKIGRIVKHNGNIINMVITLEVIKNKSVHNNHFAEIYCVLNGADIQVKEYAESMYACIDLLADKLDRQVKKHKEKTMRGQSGGASSIRNTPVEPAGEETEETSTSGEEIAENIVNINLEMQE